MSPNDEGRYLPPTVREPYRGLYHPSDLYSPNPFPYCRGIYVYGCVRGDSREDESAHAHILDDGFRGYICVWHPRILWIDDEDIAWSPRPIMWHEYAHLLEPDDGLLVDHSPHSPWGRLMRRWGLTPSRVT